MGEYYADLLWLFLCDYTVQKGPEIKVPAQGVYSKSPHIC